MATMRHLIAILLVIPMAWAGSGETKQASIEPGAFLAINALAFTNEATGEVIRRRLEMNWYGIPDGADIAVALYDEDPEQGSAFPMIILGADEYPFGYFITDIQLENVTNEDIGYSKKCVFPYWIRLLDGNDATPLTEPRCLSNQPTWMEDHASEIGSLQLQELMLVAAHDASAWRQYECQGDDNWATAATFTQEENLLGQLQYGVRFQDMRIAYYPTTPERFWLVHGPIKAHPLQEGLDLITTFLRNSRDIIVWDSHSFSLGMDQPWPLDVHNEYKDILKEAFGPFWVKPQGGKNWSLTLDEIWNISGLPADQGRVIHIYENSHTEEDWFFPNIPEYWGNKDDPQELKDYLDEKIFESVNNPEDYAPCWRPNCQMTPTAPDIIFEKYTGLRQMADVVNRNMTYWWRTDYRDVTSVYTLHDYVLSSDMVQVAIERNLRTASEKRERDHQFDEVKIHVV